MTSVPQVNAPQNDWSWLLKLDLYFAAVFHECFLNGVLLSTPVPCGLEGNNRRDSTTIHEAESRRLESDDCMGRWQSLLFFS